MTRSRAWLLLPAAAVWAAWLSSGEVLIPEPFSSSLEKLLVAGFDATVPMA